MSEKKAKKEEQEKERKHQISITHKAKLLLYEEMAMGETYSDTIIRILVELHNSRVMWKS